MPKNAQNMLQNIFLSIFRSLFFLYVGSLRSIPIFLEV